jgi:hypothetical protein
MAKHRRVRRSRAWRRAGLLTVGAVTPLVWLSMAAVAAPAHTATVADSAEAWYAAAPVDICTTPLGCPPPQVPSSPYPADTLHVGVAGGQETARTYVVPNLFALPLGATLTGGTMTLPVVTDANAGTVSPDTAKILACLATKPVTDGTQGSTQAPPDVDCKTSAPLKYDAKKTVFTVDLAPLLSAWAKGAPQFGIGLVPDTSKAQPSDAWHVAFNGRKRTGPHISSLISYTPPAPIPTPASAPAPTQAAPPPPVSSGNTPSVSLPPPTTAQPPAAAPQVAPTQPQPIAQQPVALTRSFQYPMAFLMPLALLVGAVFFVRLFTRDPIANAVSR